MTKYADDLHARLVELDRSASPAPWAIYRGEWAERIIGADGEPALYTQAPHDVDLQMTIEARNAFPALLAEIERLREEVQTAKADGWDEGYADKDAEPSEAMIERGLRKPATNPYRKEEQ